MSWPMIRAVPSAEALAFKWKSPRGANRAGFLVSLGATLPSDETMPQDFRVYKRFMRPFATSFGRMTSLAAE
jgi:hypothetical protein